MQSMAPEPLGQRTKLRISRPPPVQRIGKDRVTDRAGVHADLVGPAGLELEADQRGSIAESLDDSHGRERPSLAVVRRKAATIGGVTPMASLDPTLGKIRDAKHDAQVRALDRVLAKLPSQTREHGR